ncbi:MAG: KtrAB potassium uptake system, peripheral membrane component KtrA [uncultured Nocardioidaceae bacterium]|uniref:KtrAB potassium uptake system, peripheral membrane component KtrA n=1 Tax=uncultured Nocardioidaceae bacterium TaxID=253824 RepID=A0A6J4LYP1_9ACTN|nr:MAG: KtrAB potassium uptake system, peripheral membrane component KtrA [uncultured Nocardioidaceae bacterium]
MSARKVRTNSHTSVVVIGLGRFGIAVAETLVRMGHEVLAIDEDGELVERWSHSLTYVVQADSTDDEALRQLGVGQFDRAVVAIGTEVEASVLTVLALAEAGVADVWAKAINRKHGHILERVGATHVVYPESSMGERVAHLLTGAMIDYIEFDDDFSIARTRAPRFTWEKTLADSAPRSHYGVTVVGVKRQGQDFIHGRPETLVRHGDELVVSGTTRAVEKFSGLT